MSISEITWESFLSADGGRVDGGVLHIREASCMTLLPARQVRFGGAVVRLMHFVLLLSLRD